LPYSGGFGKDGGKEFEFVDDFYDGFEDIKALRRFRKKVKTDKVQLYLLTPKTHKTLNTQFGYRESVVNINPDLGYIDGSKVLVKSLWGELELIVKNSNDLRDDIAVIYCGVDGINKLTPPISSTEGDMACYGDVKVTIEKV